MKKIVLVIFFIFSFESISQSENFNLKKIASLTKPWGSTFINDRELLITEKIGKIKLVNIDDGKIIEIKHNLKFKNAGQGGLLDIVYKDNYVWISYTEEVKKRIYSTSIARGKLNKKKIKFKNIFRSKPDDISTEFHFGSRLAIKDDYLFASIGERGLGGLVQDPKNHLGSIIRIKLNGKIPKDNPKFTNKPDWLPEIYQIGVRNPQGLTASTINGKVFASNHGAKGGDWFGEIKKGENYGWPILGWGGTNYDGSKIGPKWKPGFTKAIQYWVPSIGASAITIYKGKEFSEWDGNALIASLRAKSLIKLDFQNLNEVKEEIIFKNKIDRIRDIQVHPSNGKIYLLSEKNYGQKGPEEDGLWLMEKN